MGSKGPKRTPTAQLLNRGSWRGKERSKTEPTPEPEELPCPDFLKNEAKAEWERLAPTLANQGVLTAWDRAALVAYCHQWALYMEINGAIKALLIKTIAGDARQNPLIRMRKETLEQLIRLAQEFGLTPATRSRVERIEKGEEPDADELRIFKNSG